MNEIQSMADIQEVMKSIVQMALEICEEHHVPEQVTNAFVVTLVDTSKMLMGEYHRLVSEGKVPLDEQFKFDMKLGMDAINEALGDDQEL